MKSQKTIQKPCGTAELLLFFLFSFVAHSAQAIQYTQQFSVCATLLIASPRVDVHGMGYSVEPKERLLRDLSPTLKSYPDIHFTKPQLGLLSMKNLSPEEQRILLDFANMRVTYQELHSQHEKNIQLAQNPAEKEAALNNWKEQLRPFAEAALALGVQQRLRLLGAAIFDFNREGGKQRYPQPEDSLAFRIADMINSASRATYEIENNTSQNKRHLIREHFLATYIMAIFQDNQQVGLYRDQIYTLFPELLDLHPELRPESPETLAYKESIVPGSTHKYVWESYIPLIDETILDFLIFSPSLSFE